MSRSLPPTGTGLGSLQPSDRRAFVRYLFDPAAEHPSAAVQGYGWLAKVRDLSRTGVSLLTPVLFQPGKTLALDLVNAQGEHTETLLVEIVHVEPCSGGESLLGGAFMPPLTAAQLQVLLS